MSLTIKLFRNILFGSCVSLLPIITSSCSTLELLNKKNYLETVEYKVPYFANLIRLKQQEQGIKVNNSILFDQFSIIEDEDKKNKYFSDFLEDSQVTITSVKDFSHYITNKINSLYKELEIPKTLSDEEIQRIFENDFLNGQNLNEVLAKNNIWISQSIFYHSSVFVDYILKEEDKDYINVKIIRPNEIDQDYLSILPTSLLPARKVFNILVFPKEKMLNFKKTTKDENIKLLSELYNHYNYKEKDFFNWYYPRKWILDWIDNIQRKQGIFNTKNLILKNKAGAYISKEPLNLDSDSGIKVIKNFKDFITYIMSPFQTNDSEKDSALSYIKVVNDFEKNYLNGKNLSELLEENNLVVQRTIQKENTSFNKQYRFVKLPNSSSSKINLAIINDNELNFSSNFLDNEWEDPFIEKPRILYQGLLVPKNSKVEIKGQLNFKEANDFLIHNKSLYKDKEVTE
ncbi:hypothetical protein NPA08_02085 [Mycoplasmopsis citelli]|uniref:Lipoprotein n=1 Tax=Mycoplasmopsis citelli TaxID=171281 RepID=A0A449B112_9BACT|nr:hypothetical protein [Mycoplasmopsis citelli]UUD36595.1 hypothetical protein NPA08_02085 [Mycoplasmopsis citelli]VEU74234.1 Uncharacterised protein [Mycoplasmopsis citelli]